ncbi:MAG TPA: acetate/propionate family kinase [Candidatus Saccharimonadales bacterium]
MNTRRPYVLTLNAGSSSIKFGLYETAHSNAVRLFEGEISGIGLSVVHMNVHDKTGKLVVDKQLQAPDHATAVKEVISWVRGHVPDEELAAVGHRLVHGGPFFYESRIVTADILQTLHGMTIFDPLHLPNEIELIKTCMQVFSRVPQVACFDTAFHHNLPTVARLLPLPRMYEAKGLRRYGFHGLSCTYILSELERIAGVETAAGRVIIAHLGNGVSLTAVHEGVSLDTTMSLTPAAGVPMSTRSGDIDPGIVRYLARAEGQTADQFDEMVNERSGLLGISGSTADMEELLQQEAHDTQAKDAVDIFCYSVKKQIGALTAAMGGLDTLVFTGGMGEKAPKIRARISEGLEFLGIQLDPRMNEQNKEVISAHGSRVTVRMLHTDESQVIVQEVMKIQGETQA